MPDAMNFINAESVAVKPIISSDYEMANEDLKRIRLRRRSTL